MFTPDGVCVNCLNGRHDICTGCKCAGREHKQWWFRDDGITNEREALETEDEKAKATDAGRRKYPPDGLWEGIACTCNDGCPDACKGGCGCSACSGAYHDAIDWD